MYKPKSSSSMSVRSKTQTVAEVASFFQPPLSLSARISEKKQPKNLLETRLRYLKEYLSNILECINLKVRVENVLSIKN